VPQSALWTSVSGRFRDTVGDNSQVPGRWLTLRGFSRNVVYLWRTSLPFRTIAISVALTSITVLSIGLLMSNSIANDLYRSRLTELLSESDRATTQAQATFHSGVETDAAALTALRQQAFDTISTSAPNAYGFAFFRVPGTTGQQLQDVTSDGIDPSLVTAELRTAVEQNAGGQASGGKQQYQSIELTLRDGERVPGVVVGTTVEVPTAGQHELYLVYSLAESQSTLDFVQRTLVVSMVVLVLIIAIITGFVMRAVIQPIRIAAQTSRKLAAGQLEERIPERGEDDIATLSRSFNDMADSLQDQIERLEDLSQVQQRFVSDVSHELRTPLTTIRLAGAMLYNGREDFEPAMSRSVELLHDQVERFDLLLSDLLEISRMDAGAIDTAREPGSLQSIADDVIGNMSPIALDHGSHVWLARTDSYAESEFDARRITRVVRNLLGNAIEHGEGKPIVVSVATGATAAAISVRDYGVGMTPEQQSRVFDRFWRADPSRKRTMGGSGLGLAISYEDAVLHDGRLEVWSAPGLGTNFRLTIPRRVGDEIESSPLPLQPDDAGETTIDLPSDVGVGAVDEVFSGVDVDTQPIDIPAIQAAIAAGDREAEVVAEAELGLEPADRAEADAAAPASAADPGEERAGHDDGLGEHDAGAVDEDAAAPRDEEAGR